MPDWTGELRARLSELRLSPEREAEIVEETSQHLEQRYEELRAAGAGDADARRLVIDELRQDDALADRMRALRQAHVPPGILPGEPSRSLLQGLWQDLRYALRTLRKQPGFAVTASLTLALGIGANSAIFALVDATLLRPLPLAEPDRLVRMYERSNALDYGAVAPLNMVDWNAQSRSFDAIGAFIPGVGSMVMAGENGIAETVPRQWVTAGIFDALGIKPIVGRTFTPSDDWRQARVVVLSEGFWKSRFGADPSIVGRDIRLDGEPYTVVGVVPGEAQLIGRSSIWGLFAVPPVPQLRTTFFLSVVGRMKPGITIDAATADMAAVAEGLAREFPATNAGRGVSLLPLRDVWIGSDLRLTSLLFLGVVGFVLLICCANVANLLLTRAAVRARELAIRSALGAARQRIIRQLLTESLVLATGGGVLGAGIGWAILRAAPSVVPPEFLPAAVQPTFDLRVAVFCTVTAVLIGLVFGLAPAWKATGVSSMQALKTAGRSVTADGRWLRRFLVVTEVSTAVLLLYGAGLLLRTLIAVDNVDRGYRADRALTMMVDPLSARYPTSESLLQFYDAVEQEISSLPGVRSVAWTSALPLRSADDVPLLVDVVGDPPVAENERSVSEGQIVSPKYFETVDLPLIAGRVFDDRDTSNSTPVCIVSEAFVRRYAQGRPAVGLRLAIRPQGSEAPPVINQVIGVVRQVKGRPEELQDPVQIYVPMAQRVDDDLYVVVRAASGDAAALTPGVRAAIGRIDREQLVSVRDVMTFEDIARDSTSRQRFRALLVTTSASLALLLAMIGVFGVLAYSVQERVREIGVRRALGATASDVIRLVAGSAFRPIAAGVVIGLALATVFGRLLATMLFGVEPLDPATFATVTLVLVVTAVVATAVPAWRAIHVEPVIALRSE